jgi:glycosyltransferase involved in cell wall biosynthesis
MNPDVSVVMLSYNVESYIEEAIKSILNQTYSNYELIILDDCSTDSTCDIIETIRDERIKLLKHSVKNSIPILRNKSFDIAKGKYIAIMDSDDIAPDYRILDQYRFMEENTDIDVLSGDFESLDGQGARTNFPADHESICYGFLFRCYVANSAAFLRKEIIAQTGVRYDERSFVCSDYGYWIDLIPNVRFHNLKGKVYLQYRRGHKESITTMTTENENKIIQRDTIVNGIRYKLFSKLGLSISDIDYSNYCKFFCYQKNENSLSDYNKLEELFVGLKKQALQTEINTDLFFPLLDKWLMYAKKSVTH